SASSSRMARGRWQPAAAASLTMETIRPPSTTTSARYDGSPLPSTTSASRMTSCSTAGTSRALEEGADVVDDRAVRLGHGDQLPLVERRARVRQAQADPVADLEVRAGVRAQPGVLV